MTLSTLHARKFKKNLAVLGLVLGFIAVIWAVTVIRIAANVNASATPTVQPPENAVE